MCNVFIKYCTLLLLDNWDLEDEIDAPSTSGNQRPSTENRNNNREEVGTNHSQNSTSQDSSTASNTEGDSRSNNQHDSSGSSSTKRPIDSSSNQQKKNKQDGANPKTTNQAQNIAEGSGSTPGEESTGTHQVDTPSGPDHNTKGSLQGEAGNRKIQSSLSITDTKVCLRIKILSVILYVLKMQKMLIY